MKTKIFARFGVVLGFLLSIQLVSSFALANLADLGLVKDRQRYKTHCNLVVSEGGAPTLDFEITVPDAQRVGNGLGYNFITAEGFEFQFNSGIIREVIIRTPDMQSLKVEAGAGVTGDIYSEKEYKNSNLQLAPFYEPNDRGIKTDLGPHSVDFAIEGRPQRMRLSCNLIEGYDGIDFKVNLKK